MPGQLPGQDAGMEIPLLLHVVQRRAVHDDDGQAEPQVPGGLLGRAGVRMVDRVNCIPSSSIRFRLTRLYGVSVPCSVSNKPSRPDRIVNVHPSLIPAFCGKGYYGLKVHEAALRRGVRVTGATVHLVNEIPDGGRILLQKAVDILPGDTPETLQRRVMEQAEWVLLPQAAEQLAAHIATEKEEHL